jgi:hypothetical protein
MLGLEVGLSGTSPAVARGGGATDATRQQGVVVVLRLELRREQVLAQEKLRGRWGMDVAADYNAHAAFYRMEEGGEMVPWRRNG